MTWFTDLFWSGTAATIVVAVLLTVIIWIVWVYGYNKE